MRYKVFAVPACGDEDAEQRLNQFLASHKIVQVERQLVTQAGYSLWSFCVGYQLNSTPGEASPKKARVDYKAVLSEDEFACFAMLRELRKREAEKEGVPVFALFTNDQLAAMAQNRVKSIAQLQAIEGVGESKVRRYGPVFLEGLQRFWASHHAEANVDPAH